MNTPITFDPPEIIGALTGAAEVTDVHGSDSPPNALRLFAQRLPAGSVPLTTTSGWSKTFGVTPGEACPIKFKVNGDQASPIRLVLTITDVSTVTTVNLIAPLGLGFLLWEAISYVPLSSFITLALSAPAPTSLPGGSLGISGFWLVDSGQVGPDDALATEDDMGLDREPIYEALFERLQTVPGFATCSRKWKHWDEVPAASQPAMFVTIGDQTPENHLGVQPPWLIESTVFLYFRVEGEDIPGTKINAALKAIEEALEWRPADLVNGTQFGMERRHQTTLGGLVQYAWMTPVITVEGVAANQAAVKFGVEMRAAALVAA